MDDTEEEEEAGANAEAEAEGNYGYTLMPGQAEAEHANETVSRNGSFEKVDGMSEQEEMPGQAGHQAATSPHYDPFTWYGQQSTGTQTDVDDELVPPMPLNIKQNEPDNKTHNKSI